MSEHEKDPYSDPVGNVLHRLMGETPAGREAAEEFLEEAREDEARPRRRRLAVLAAAVAALPLGYGLATGNLMAIGVGVALGVAGHLVARRWDAENR